MGSGSSMFQGGHLAEGPIRWYLPDSAASREWQALPLGFGPTRRQSFVQGATWGRDTNRVGNEKGELEGRIVFYSRANSGTDYDKLERCPTVNLGSDTKLFAKAFLGLPLGRLPIGENNLPPADVSDGTDGDAPPYVGSGPVLLALVPHAVAIFVDVDDSQKPLELFCKESVLEWEAEQRKRSEATKSDAGSSRDEAPEGCESEGSAAGLGLAGASPSSSSSPTGGEGAPVRMEKAVKGSFVTYLVSRVQDPFYFLHLPLVCTRRDCQSADTGPYPLTLVRAFTDLLASVTPAGPHKVKLTVRLYYNHRQFSYLPLDKGLHPKAVWHGGLDNRWLGAPHRTPAAWATPAQPLAQGTVEVVVPGGFARVLVGLLDRRLPPEMYDGADVEDMRAEARVVAVGQFCELLKVDGFPDVTILTSPRLERRQCDVESGYRYRYEYIEFAACWLDPKNSGKSGVGVMVDGCMAKGETGPRQFSKTWTAVPLRRRGHPIDPQPVAVNNAYILTKLVARRRRQSTALGY